jgi:hypothetical protein
MNATINGNLHGNREYRFEVVRGPFVWLFPSGQQQGGTIAGNSVTTRTDHLGDARAILRVNAGVNTQIGVLRVVDVATGASTNHAFIINGVTTSGPLVVIPEELSFTGATTAQCGTGATDVLVFDGQPPYRATSTTPNVTVTPDRSDENPGRFTVAATNPFVCLSEATVVITDASGRRATVTVTTEAGSAAPPPSPISVTPTQIALGCNSTGSVSVLGGPTSTGTGGGGGAATFSATSADSRITTTVSGRTVSITRIQPDPAGTPVSPTPGIPNLINYTVTVTDGTSTSTVGVNAPSNCPP